MEDLDLGATIRSFSKDQKVFGRYALIKAIGRGGMGIVWLARDDKLEREVALKFLPEIVAQDARAVEDLKRETRRSLELTHPNIVRIYDFIDDARAAAISMEYVAGDNLSKRGAAQPNCVFSLVELRPWVKQLCDALTYAHTKAKIVHLDLKPANLMLDAAGDLKVADFGIAANISDSVSRVTQRAGTSGTPVYMSPQQMMGEPPAVTDDVYALGATLYELLTGKPPFYAGNIFMQVNDKVAPPLNERRQANAPGAEPVPPAWEATIAACLQKRAEDRPQSAAEVWGRLNASEVMEDLTTRDAKSPKEVTRSREPEGKNQKAVPPPASAKPQPEPPESNPTSGPQVDASSAISASPAAGASPRPGQNQTKAGRSLIEERAEAKPASPGRKLGLKLTRRGVVLAMGVVAALAVAALLAFARYGNPIYMPAQVNRLAVRIGNPNIKPEVPRAWVDLCLAWDTWLSDLKDNGPRLLRTEALWEKDDQLRRELADFVATSNELLPATLVPAAAGQKRLGILANSPPQAVLNELQTVAVEVKVSEAYRRVQSLASRLERWPRWEQLRELEVALVVRSLSSSVSALHSRLPPGPGDLNYQLNSGRTLRFLNDLSLDDTGLLLVASRWSEILQLSHEMATSGDRVQMAMPRLIGFRALNNSASLGELAASLVETLDDLRLRREQFLEPQLDRERFLRESALQTETGEVTRADFPRWEKELARFSKVTPQVVEFTPADREGLQALGIYARALRPEEKTSPRVFITLPERERPRESDYEVADARFEDKAVREVIRLAMVTGLIDLDHHALDDVAKSLATSYDAFTAVAPNQGAKNFRAWLETSKDVDAVRVLDYLKKLQDTLKRIELLGLTRPEMECSKAQIYGSVLRARLNAEPEFLRTLVEGSPALRM